jgi:HNH endonuclease
MTTKISTSITWDELVSVLDYNADTGIFVWKETRGRILKGSIAGCLEDDGYVTIRINRKVYKAHRLAWFYCFKEWPTLDIDHINRIRSDNSLDNLRELTRADNNRNSIARNSTESKNVYKNGPGFMARVSFNGKDTYLGTFKTIDLANESVIKFKKENNIL